MTQRSTFPSSLLVDFYRSDEFHLCTFEQLVIAIDADLYDRPGADNLRRRQLDKHNRLEQSLGWHDDASSIGFNKPGTGGCDHAQFKRHVIKSFVHKFHIVQVRDLSIFSPLKERAGYF